jgi:hypothetical protein
MWLSKRRRRIKMRETHSRLKSSDLNQLPG